MAKAKILIIEDLFKIIKTLKPPDVIIQLEIDPECDPILSNPTQINQLVINLCTNAFHSMREKGGVLTLSLKKIAIDSTTAKKFYTLHQGSYLRLSVSDTGHGMDPKIVDKIFEPSFSTKGTGEGFGLGLAIVRDIVKTHKGEIVVDTKPGKGTTFHMYFPITKKRTKKTAHKAEKIKGGNENILLVDDEQSIAEMLSISLQRLGYNVTALTSSLKALEKFQDSPNNFDIVITDQIMPGLSGDLLVIELLKIKPDIPIIICTGFSEEINKEKATELGIKEFLLKPFTRLQLCQTIRNILDENK